MSIPVYAHLSRLPLSRLRSQSSSGTAAALCTCLLLRHRGREGRDNNTEATNRYSERQAHLPREKGCIGRGQYLRETKERGQLPNFFSLCDVPFLLYRSMDQDTGCKRCLTTHKSSFFMASTDRCHSQLRIGTTQCATPEERQCRRAGEWLNSG